MKQKEPNTFVKLLIVIGRFIAKPFRWIDKKLHHPFKWLWRKVYTFFRDLDYKGIAWRIIKILNKFFHWLIFKVILPKKYRHATKREIYSVIFNSDTPAGRRFDIWLLILIGVNLLIIMLDSFAMIHNNLRVVLVILEWLLTFIFTLEYYLRIYCSPNKRQYIFSFYGIIDFLSIFPAYLSILVPATHTLSVLRVLRTLRIFRIFNMQKFMQESFHLLNALRRSAKKIVIFMLFMLVAAIIIGAMLYMLEGDVNPALTSIPRAIYWAVMTISTVGYGDITPVTTLGQILSSCVMLLGYSIIAVPTGIITGETIREYRGEAHHEEDDDDDDSNEARYCPHCGHNEENPKARYCCYCGARLAKNSERNWITNFFSGPDGHFEEEEDDDE